MKHLAFAAVSLALAGCATDRVDSAAGPGAGAELRDGAGQVRAQAAVAQVGDALRIRVEASGLAPGRYAAHIHSVGRCDPPAFESASGHWNPTGRQHGRDNPQGMHKGDLPDLVVGADGRGTVEHMIAGAWLSAGTTPMLDADGAAMMIHQRPDDNRTDPSGNAGARIACGVFR